MSMLHNFPASDTWMRKRTGSCGGGALPLIMTPFQSPAMGSRVEGRKATFGATGWIAFRETWKTTPKRSSTRAIPPSTFHGLNETAEEELLISAAIEELVAISGLK